MILKKHNSNYLYTVSDLLSCVNLCQDVLVNWSGEVNVINNHYRFRSFTR